MEIIERREEKIKQAIKIGCSPENLIYQDIFYRMKQLIQSPVYLKNEKIGITKHLKRLITHGEPYTDYYEAFIKAHSIKEEYIDYCIDLSTITKMIGTDNGM